MDGVKSSQGEYALWLQPEEGSGLLAKPGEPIQPLTSGQGGVGALDEKGIPTQIEGYTRLTRAAVIPIINDLSAIYFGAAPQTVRIRSLGGAVESESLYKYDASRDVIVNQQTGELYSPIEGTFTSETGETLTPGVYCVYWFGVTSVNFWAMQGIAILWEKSLSGTWPLASSRWSLVLPWG